MNEFLPKYNVVGFPCGNTGMQWGGWFRKEIKSAADLQGLKMRIAGLAGHVAVEGRHRDRSRPRRATSIPRSSAARSMRSNISDPYDDEKLGFNRDHRILLHARLAGGRHGLPRHDQQREMDRASRISISARLKSPRRPQRPRCSRITTPKIRKRCRRIIANGVKVSVFPTDVIEKMYKRPRRSSTKRSIAIKSSLRENLRLAKGIPRPQLFLPPGGGFPVRQHDASAANASRDTDRTLA